MALGTLYPGVLSMKLFLEGSSKQGWTDLRIQAEHGNAV